MVSNGIKGENVLEADTVGEIRVLVIARCLDLTSFAALKDSNKGFNIAPASIDEFSYSICVSIHEGGKSRAEKQY